MRHQHATAMVACTPDSRTASQSMHAERRRYGREPPHAGAVERDQRAEIAAATAERAAGRPAGVEDRDHEHRAQVVDDGQRREEHLTGRRARAAPSSRSDRRERRRCRSPSGCPSRGAVAAACSAQRVDAAPADSITAERPSDAGSAAWLRRRRARRPASSRLISSPTSKKKTAISPSSTQWCRDSVQRRLRRLNGHRELPQGHVGVAPRRVGPDQRCRP